MLEQSVSARNSECLAKKDKNRSKCSLFLRKNTVISAISPNNTKLWNIYFTLLGARQNQLFPFDF